MTNIIMTMKKSKKIDWFFIAVFTAIAVGCLAFCKVNHSLAFYGVFSAGIAWVLYSERKNNQNKNVNDNVNKK